MFIKNLLGSDAPAGRAATMPGIRYSLHPHAIEIAILGIGIFVLVVSLGVLLYIGTRPRKVIAVERAQRESDWKDYWVRRNSASFTDEDVTPVNIRRRSEPTDARPSAQEPLNISRRRATAAGASLEMLHLAAGRDAPEIATGNAVIDTAGARYRRTGRSVDSSSPSSCADELEKGTIATLDGEHAGFECGPGWRCHIAKAAEDIEAQRLEPAAMAFSLGLQIK